VPQDLVNDVAFALLESSGDILSRDSRLKEIAEMLLKFEARLEDRAEGNSDKENDAAGDRGEGSALDSIERASSGNAAVSDLALERAIKDRVLRHALQNALQRPQVMRSRVYELFTA
jgi:hypothetical protein